jgi:hypothetical protein
MTRRQLLAVAAPLLALLVHLVRRLLIVGLVALLAFSPTNYHA